MSDEPIPGLPVAGYRTQPLSAIETVNGHKVTEEHLLRLLDGYKSATAIDQRWLAVARTGFEQSFMALNRAIFRPTRIELSDDQDSAG